MVIRTLLALLFTATLLVAVASHDTALAGVTTVSVDVDVTGNSATVVSTIEECRTEASGSTVDIDIVIENVSTLAGFEGDLFYDSSLVSIVGSSVFYILSEPLFPPPFIFDLSDPVPDTDGQYHMLASSTGGGSGQGVIFRLTLQAASSGVSLLNLDNLKMKDDTNTTIQPADAQGLFTGPIIDGRIGVDVSCDPDADGDGVPDSSDNCPAWPNPLQGLPLWPVPVGDDDCDGWTGADETTIGTDPNVACDDDLGLDDWPPDFDNSQAIDIVDVFALKPVFNTTVPPTSARYDLAPNGTIDIVDVFKIKPVFNESCT